MESLIRLALASMYAVPNDRWARMFPDDSNPTAEREHARRDEAAMANARRIEALDVPEPFFIVRDMHGRRYYVQNPARVAYDQRRDGDSR